MTSKVALPETNYPVPAGFRWGAVYAGIKYKNRNDVGICAVEQGSCSAAAVFTQNSFAAAPVLVSREILAHGGGQIGGVVVNAGCANAATGEEGLRNARTMAERAATSCKGSPFLVCSTGTIGVQLPMEKVERAIGEVAKSAATGALAFAEFARCILTTDTREKIASAVVELGGKQVTILGCAKGSGMMQPKMATMLAYVFTDAAAQPGVLQQMLSEANEHSLNCMTIDGDTSTNDTAILMASGASGVDVTAGQARDKFAKALLKVLQSIARQLARDGEGASKLIEVQVSGTDSFLSARQAALMVANSPLVKTAIYGRDANWGRIAMALGNAGLKFRVEDVSIRLGSLDLFRQGAPLPLDEAAALKVLEEEFVRIEVELGPGPGAATVWTCDLTEKYIEINGSYRT
jgi:glutamate N-acetyltransferase/amino-acid N-acetyltransferase